MGELLPRGAVESVFWLREGLCREGHMAPLDARASVRILAGRAGVDRGYMGSSDYFLVTERLPGCQKRSQPNRSHNP
jgi:hypothetical protein